MIVLDLALKALWALILWFLGPYSGELGCNGMGSTSSIPVKELPTFYFTERFLHCMTKKKKILTLFDLFPSLTYRFITDLLEMCDDPFFFDAGYL